MTDQHVIIARYEAELAGETRLQRLARWFAAGAEPATTDPETAVSLRRLLLDGDDS